MEQERNRPQDIEGSVTQIVNDLRSGDPDAVQALWQRFFPRLIGLARKTLSRTGGVFADAEDAVQSAFVSFWSGARQGDFDGEFNRNRAWRLLATITVRKVLKQRERQQAVKRGGGRVISEAALVGKDGHTLSLDQLLGGISTVELDACCEEELQKLDEEPRAIVVLRMMGHTNREIADLLHCSERKVDRKLQIVRMTWEDDAAS